jgi:Flp pilus assembly protein TadB
MKLRRMGLFLAVAGLVLLATSGYLWRGDAARRAEIRQETAALEDSARRLREEYSETSLKYRAFQQSLPDMPDTMQRYGGRLIMDISSGYNKALRKLHFRERDVRLEITARQRAEAKERARAQAVSLPVAAAGAASLVLGLILLLASRRRVAA